MKRTAEKKATTFTPSLSRAWTKKFAQLANKQARQLGKKECIA